MYVCMYAYMYTHIYTSIFLSIYTMETWSSTRVYIYIYVLSQIVYIYIKSQIHFLYYIHITDIFGDKEQDMEQLPREFEFMLVEQR